MDCAKRVEKMWSPSGGVTKMDEFRQIVNRELQLTLGMLSLSVALSPLILFLHLFLNLLH